MALEDFFTLTEMKDGLATLARVEELFSVMQKQKDRVRNNVGDAIRQWSTVSSVLTATENKDCLNCFMQLNGLWFLNHWLQEAQKLGDDASDTSVEELINTVLGVLEKIPVDPENSSVCRIGKTFQELLGHRSINVQERVRTLLDKWIQVNGNGSSCQNLEKHETNFDEEAKPSAYMSRVEGVMAVNLVVDASPSKVGTSEGSHEIESAVSGSLHSNDKICPPDRSESDTIKNGKIFIPSQSILPTNLASADANIVSAGMNSLDSSLVSNPSQGSVSIGEEFVCPAAGVASSTDTCSSPVASGKNIDDRLDFPKTRCISDGPKEMKIEVNTEKLSPSKSSQEGTVIASLPSVLTASPVTKTAVTREVNLKESQTCKANTSEPQQNGGIWIPKYSGTTQEIKLVGHAANSFQCIYGEGHISRKHMGSESSACWKYGLGTAADSKHRDGDSNVKVTKGLDSILLSASLNPVGCTSTVNEMEGSSEMGLEYGEIDALEIAWQVAIEVEHEVVDYREPCCSSSPGGNSEGKIMDSSSPDIAENEHEKPVIEQLNGNESPTRKGLSEESSKENGSRILGNTEFGLKKAGHELDSRKPAFIQESVGNMEKSKCNFDLNEDICTEETDCPVVLMPNQMSNLSAPIPICALKGAPRLVVTSLHFEGESGWRGSAATSAFRPASPRRILHCEKTVSCPKQKVKFLGIDLNLAEGDDDVPVDPVLDRPIPVSSGLPAGDSSIEISSRRAERLKLDLNRLGDEDTLPNQLFYWKLHQQNGNHSPSPASSSSSRQPLMRDIDLNDNPSPLGACGSNSLSKSSSKDTVTYGSFSVDDPVITSRGSRMSVERKDLFNQTHPSFLGNGLTTDSMIGARSSVSYPHMALPPCGYNGLPMGPHKSLPPAFYPPGSIPYMVDLRGATVIPQTLGSSAGLNGVPSCRPPFLMSIAGAPSGFNVSPGLDLNSGIAPMESGNREVGNLKQLFMQGNGIMEEQMRSSPQPAAVGMALKRKEPDCGWEPCTYGYKHVTSWQ